jgi:hypothetical protein
MAILQPKVDRTEGEIKTHEYETTKVKFDLDKMHVGDKIEWDKQNGNMVSRDFIQATMNVKKLKGMVNKLEI